ncbi:MAG: DUF4421 domain-containing protein [Prevotella sp.]|nr:DUF4421 domain-containing protein [Prevotella sp.]
MGTDSIGMAQEKPHHKKRYPVLNTLYCFFKEFSRVDTDYVEPQHYNFTFMLQNTNTYEIYHLRNKSGQEVVFSPRPAYKLGPYFGWRWIFLGYTIDLTHLKDGDGRQDFNLSLYSNQIGVDLFYRKSGDSYRINSLTLGSDFKISEMEDVPFNGFQSSVKGFNLYYIFNHRKFSYPAAYSQSTVQRRSAGSPIVGIGYTKHKLNIDWQAFDDLVCEKVGTVHATGIVDSTMVFSNVNYTDYSLSGGYAYNWVFAHNWLFDISLQAALAYKRSTSDINTSDNGFLRSFDFRNINIDGILRTGVVWNNTKWYAGANSIFHAYNYRKSQFSTNNIFGSVNFYVGFNFGKR